MLSPWRKKLSILGLGTSVGGVVEAPIVVVSDFSQLNSETCANKVVVFNYNCDWERNPDACYGQMATYRVDGASKAAVVGALAVLVRSLTGTSLNTPHTGVQHYATGVKQIPAACITTEDADLFQRLSDRGVPVTVRLSMEAKV